MIHSYDISAKRFDKWVEKLATECGCWIWTGCTHGNGYGKFSIRVDGRVYQTHAHRASWMLHHGSFLPSSEHLMHSCDNRICVNPAHLSIGNPKLNMEDCVRKKRHSHGEKSHLSVLTEDDVKKIREHHASGETQKSIACRFGVTRNAVASAVYGLTWKHIPGFRPLLERPKQEKLNRKDVERIRRMYGLGYKQREIAARFNLTQSYVSEIILRKKRKNAR